jgi:hypothetical protein
MTELETSDPARQLRAELKEWEKAFAAANDGRKASREDIKTASEIGQYEQIRPDIS